MKTRRLTIWLALAFVGSVLLTGCGRGDRPPLGYVTGRVTIDGEPLVGVIVTFLPESGRPAVATTDADGRYELEYLGGVKGAKIGPTTVAFMPPTGGSTSHPIPDKYQNKSEFQVEVQRGKNVFDFDLESGDKAATNAARANPGDVID
jgi:hypothetical protein